MTNNIMNRKFQSDLLELNRKCCSPQILRLIRSEHQPSSKNAKDEENSTQATASENRVQEIPQNESVSRNDSTSEPRKTKPVETVIRFRRPVLADDVTSGMTDSYETLTLSEVHQLDSQRDADVQLQLEELHLALGDFDEADEFEEVDDFEEVDEFEEDWEEGVGVNGDWDVEGDDIGYCEAGDCGEEFLDDHYQRITLY